MCQLINPAKNGLGKVRKLIIEKINEKLISELHFNQWKNTDSTACSYQVMYVFQSESTFYSCLNVKELLARNRCEIWSLHDCNRAWTHNHLVRKGTLSQLAKLASLAKWLSVLLWPKWLWVRVPLQSLNTDAVSKWFIDISKKNDCSFIQLDIKEFYPSINEDVLTNVFQFAKLHTTTDDKDLCLIMHCMKSLLFFWQWNLEKEIKIKLLWFYQGQLWWCWDMWTCRTLFSVKPREYTS